MGRRTGKGIHHSQRILYLAPVLVTFDPGKPITVETDASDYAIGACLSQPDENEKLHPVAFYSRRMSLAELNYDIHDKALLAIVVAFQQWKVYLEKPKYNVSILTDHKNLIYVTSTKVHNQRQARWAEKLVRFNHKITYQKGSENNRADAISRRSDYLLDKASVSHAIITVQENGDITHNTQQLAAAFPIRSKKYTGKRKFSMGTKRMHFVKPRTNTRQRLFARQRGTTDNRQSSVHPNLTP